MKMNKENEKKFDLPARKPISISFDDRTEYFEPENFKPDVATNKRRAMINDQIDSSTKFNTTNNANNPMKIRMRSRYSTFISGISQFDPYQELTATQIAAFRQVFDTVDRDGGGSIDAEELFHSMRDVEPSLKLEEIKEILEELDQDGNGTIDFEEFLYMMTSMSMQIKGILFVNYQCFPNTWNVSRRHPTPSTTILCTNRLKNRYSSIFVCVTN